MNKIIKLFKYILDGNYNKIYITIFLSITSSILEMISIGLILPLLYFVNTNQHNILIELHNISFKINLEIIVILFGLFSLLAGLLRVYQLKWNSQLAFNMGKILNNKIFENFIMMPYCNYVQLDKISLLDVITKKTDTVIYGIVLQIINLVSSLILLIFILLLTFIIDPLISLCTFFVLGAIYSLIIFASKTKLKYYGYSLNIESSNILKLLKETVGIFRDIKLDLSHKYFIDKFKLLESQLRTSQSNINFLTSYPRYAIEYCALVIISLIILIGIQNESNISNLIPSLILIAIAGQRLMPVIQMIYSAVTNILSSKSSLDSLFNLLNRRNYEESIKYSSLKFNDNDSINLNNISYSISNLCLFENVCLEIKFGMKIGIIGKSGIGKSTLMDIIMGLIKPTNGSLMINNNPLTGDILYSYQKIISHVPQNIYIIDGTILDNILLEYSPNNIDFIQLNFALKVSELENYINGLKDGINTYIGSEGCFISGGQKQRIGIARAIYKKSKIIFLDEATSALDKDTESRIFDNLRLYLPNTTFFIITHDHRNLKNCDFVYKIDNKSLVKVSHENI